MAIRNEIQECQDPLRIEYHIFVHDDHCNHVMGDVSPEIITVKIRMGLLLF